MLRPDVAGLCSPKFCVALFITCACALAGPAPRLPVETFFRAPALDNLKLSPSGKYVAAVHKGGKEGPFLSCLELETGRRTIVIGGCIEDYEWVNDERIVFQDVAQGLGGLFSIGRDGSKPKVLEPPITVQRFGYGMPLRIVDVICQAADAPDELLVKRAEIFLNTWKDYPYPDVRRLNVLTGKSSLEEKNPGNVVEWYVDNNGIVRAALAMDKADVTVLYRTTRNDRWRPVSRSNLISEEMRPLGFKPGGREMYVAAFGPAETLGIHVFDCEKAELGASVWCNDGYDLMRVRYQPRSREILGVAFEAEKLNTHWFDRQLKTIQDQVDATLPGRVNELVNSSADSRKHLFSSYSDRHRTEYYLVDSEKNAFSLLAKVAPWVDAEDMAEQKPVQYRSRDGLTIHGYLTLPKDAPAQQLPLLVMPHGGPWVRDSWGKDPEVQFFANRGYAVLQMNFRGSTGYGWKFHKAGFGEYGKKMQDDVTDGVNWAIEQGIADPHRVAIFGASYGGYAALMGLATTPDLYRCGISFAGVSDIVRLLKAIRRDNYGHVSETTRIMVGDYRREQEDLDAVSPVHLVDRIRAPVLIVHGTKDSVVGVDQSERMAKALKKAGKQHELIIEKGEGHGFANETNRIELFQRVESFLEKHMK